MDRNRGRLGSEKVCFEFAAGDDFDDFDEFSAVNLVMKREKVRGGRLEEVKVLVKRKREKTGT